VKIRFPRSFSQEDQAKLERAALTCPVAKTLNPSVETPTEFTWG
jgi:hypothetical protein